VIDLAPGAVLADRFILGERLGAGGMGAVFRARDRDGREVAIKAALPDLDDGGEAARRLAREGNALQLLAHPNIVEALELCAVAGRLYLVVELIDGRPLSAIVAAGALAPRRALVLVRQLLDALEHAHGRGVVHRDLKPDNLLVTLAGAAADPFERLKVLDFGLVKLLDDAAAIVGGERLTRTGIAFGTPAYMAPEAALGRALDRRVDLYAVGVILFELLTGALPFAGDDALTLLRQHVGAPPPRLAERVGAAPWCTPVLEALVAGALAKRPDERFASAAQMRACLDDAFLALPG
jgi:serine/threonine protein kinase